MEHLEIDSFHVTKSYGGILEGVPKPQDVIFTARAQLARMWGAGRPCLLVPPELHKQGVHEFVPQRVCMAWVSGPEKDRENHGAHLFVIWFVEHIPTNILEDVKRIIDVAGGWHKNSEDFCY